VSTSSTIFMGPNGLRAGWRLLIFVAIFIPASFGANLIVDAALHKLHTEMDTALGAFVVMAVFLVPLFLASGIMAQIERRTLGDYGLPWRRAFCGQFWQGVAIALVSITAFLFALRLAGVFSFGRLALHGADIWKYGILWSVTSFLGTLLEDFLYRGYLLWVLKNYVSAASFSAASIACRVFLLSVRLSGGWQNQCCRLAEEAYESLDVLGHRCQEELLPHELQSPQA
jgi:hypothetical protein